ncbi:hypothetical protein [Nocardioides sp. LHG3406-4]|uniref:hypothetical protein n=1 Tax=Nocardioides sp. LHG3406-4 TaxID=2804575 RepID=UPI003CF3A582
MPWPDPPETGRPGREVDGAAGTADAGYRVQDLASLLTVMGCQSVAELDVMMCGFFELDPCVLEATPEHVLVVIWDRGVALRFPFTVEEFWGTVTELEDEVRQRIEDASDPEA